MIFLVPGVVSAEMADTVFARGVAYGDLLTATLAFIALAALRSRFAAFAVSLAASGRLAAHIEDSFSEPQKLSPILTTYGALHPPSDQEPRLFDFLQRPQEVGQL